MERLLRQRSGTTEDFNVDSVGLWADVMIPGMDFCTTIENGLSHKQACSDVVFVDEW